MDENEKLTQEESTSSSERFERIKDSATKILENLAALLKVKSLLTVVMTAVFAVLSLRGIIEPKDVLTVFLMIVSFYFGTQSKKE